MGKLTAKQVIAYSKADPKKYSDGEGLYFCVRKQGSPYWMIRYTTAKGRREATLGQFPLMSLADARIAAAYFRKEVRDGIPVCQPKHEPTDFEITYKSGCLGERNAKANHSS